MITRSRNGRDGWFARLRRFRKPQTTFPDLMDAAAFALAIEKERCRAERRELTFCVILFDVSNPADACDQEVHMQLARRFRGRLRMTDEVGTHRNTLAVLLPETIPSQAATVVNDLTEIAASQGITVTTEIFVFPDQETHPRHKQPAEKAGAATSQEASEGEERNARSPDQIEDVVPTHGQVGMQLESELQRTTTSPPAWAVRPWVTSQTTPWWKRGFDLFAATTGLLVLSPLFLIAALAVKLNSPGPVYFQQWREGKDGRLFRIYKFRTMLQDSEQQQPLFRHLNEQDGPAFKIKEDPRLTRIGRYLRRSCVDELPQLLNVLKGEMSLVGPRPLPVDESLSCLPWQRRRLDVLPGMTCFWQVAGRRDIPFDDWMRMDLAYVRQIGPLTDLSLISQTGLVTLLHRGSV